MKQKLLGCTSQFPTLSTEYFHSLSCWKEVKITEGATQHFIHHLLLTQDFCQCKALCDGKTPLPKSSKEQREEVGFFSPKPHILGGKKNKNHQIRKGKTHWVSSLWDLSDNGGAAVVQCPAITSNPRLENGLDEAMDLPFPHGICASFPDRALSPSQQPEHLREASRAVTDGGKQRFVFPPVVFPELTIVLWINPCRHSVGKAREPNTAGMEPSTQNIHLLTKQQRFQTQQGRG